jgi:2-polyprenyl-6-methoxyphenol hydroxylase-like FAD-dependent oxidoreductase
MAAQYDIVTIGGGLGGAALAKVMAERGYRVLVVERETEFKDRVRGEWIAPWGVAEAKELGVYDTLMAAGGYHPRLMTMYVGPMPLPSRTLDETTPQGLNQLTIYHPRMQEALLAAAEAAGAEVRRGARVRKALPGSEPSVEIEWDGGAEVKTARLIAATDGRNSVARKWGGFDACQGERGALLGGVLVEGMPDSGESSILAFNPAFGQCWLYFPQGPGHGRAYFGNRLESGLRLQGENDMPRFIQEAARTGYPAERLEGMKPAGPLATFEGYDDYVEHPYKNGIALLGDAASTSDQTWGQGVSLTLRSVRGLRDELIATEDWDAAGNAYAEKHDVYYGALREAEHWLTTVMMDQSERAGAIRARVLPQLAMNPEFLPDTFMAGPDLAPPTEEHRRRFFGEN